MLTILKLVCFTHNVVLKFLMLTQWRSLKLLYLLNRYLSHLLLSLCVQILESQLKILIHNLILPYLSFNQKPSLFRFKIALIIVSIQDPTFSIGNYKSRKMLKCDGSVHPKFISSFLCFCWILVYQLINFMMKWNFRRTTFYLLFLNFIHFHLLKIYLV